MEKIYSEIRCACYSNLAQSITSDKFDNLKKGMEFETFVKRLHGIVDHYAKLVECTQLLYENDFEFEDTESANKFLKKNGVTVNDKILEDLEDFYLDCEDVITMKMLIEKDKAKYAKVN